MAKKMRFLCLRSTLRIEIVCILLFKVLVLFLLSRFIFSPQRVSVDVARMQTRMMGVSQTFKADVS